MKTFAIERESDSDRGIYEVDVDFPRGSKLLCP